MSKHGYEQTSVAEIRELIVNQPFNFSAESLYKEDGSPKSKTELIEMILKWREENEDTSVPMILTENEEEIGKDFFEDLEEEKEEKEEGEEEFLIPEVAPQWFSEQWSEYVMRQFMEEELEDGNPTCDALRRLVNKMIGPIVNRPIVSIFPANESNLKTATVVRRVVVLVENELHPLYGKYDKVSEEEVADSGPNNTSVPYANHPSATASTRAEARAYRKLLGLVKVVSADELDQVAEQEHDINWSIGEPIADEQINVIDMLCRRTNLDVLTYINCGKSGRNYQYIEQISSEAARGMIQYLNRIQQGKGNAIKPEGVGPYSADWRLVNNDRREHALK